MTMTAPTTTVDDVAVAAVRAAKEVDYCNAKVPVVELVKFSMALLEQLGIQIAPGR